MSRRTYNLPRGGWTTDPEEYLDEWKKITTAVEDFTGCRVFGFDPGLAVCRGDGSSSFTIPLWFALAIVDQVAEVKNYLCHAILDLNGGNARDGKSRVLSVIEDLEYEERNDER